MKILFIIPPHPTRQIAINDGMPLGVLYLAAMIRDSHEVRIIDAYSFPDKSDFVDTLHEFQPDVIAVSIPFKLLKKSSIRICEIIRQNSSAIIIIGGLSATLGHERLRKNIHHDYFIYGEAEIPFKQLIDYISGIGDKVPGNVFRPDMDITPIGTMIPDINSLLFPARDLLPDRNEYMERILSSRGCGFTCRFCSSRMFWGGFRPRNPDSIVDEIETIYNDRGLTPISFADDSFTFNRKRVVELCSLIMRRNIKTGGLGFSSHPECLDENLLSIMRDAGFDSIFLGLESASPKVLKTIGKSYDKAKIEKLIKFALSIEFKIHASFMIGLPGESKDEIENTIHWADSLPIKSIGFHIFYPFDGCEIRMNPDKFGIRIEEMSEHDGDIDGEAVIHNGVLAPMEILYYYYRARSLAKMKAKG